MYSEWIDAAGTLISAQTSRIFLMYGTYSVVDAVAKDDAGGTTSASASGYRMGSKQSAAGRYDDDEDDRRYEGEGIVPDDEED